uniref:PDZ and LIM domain 5 n=1 Tax=Coturnix japonica TaxID=93934 RepID=A0A8C2T4W5_COTJA
MSNYSVSLVGPAPWGFRLQGGKDFNMPLSISRLNDGGKAARAQVGIGDVVLTIDGISTDGMTHLEAQNKIKACTGNLNMTLQRVATATKPDLIHVPKPGTHNAAPGGHVGDGTQELAEGLRRGFRENQGDNKQQNGKIPPKRPPRKHIVDTYTEFYHTPTHSDASKKRLIEDTEDWHPRTGTTQSRSFRILAQITGTDHMKEPEHEGAKKSKIPTDLRNRAEAQDTSTNLSKNSVATQALEIPPVPSTSLIPMSQNSARPESAAAFLPIAESSPSSAPSPRLTEHIDATVPGRHDASVPTSETNAFGIISSCQSKSSISHTSDSMESTPPATYTTTSVKNVSASHECPDPRPTSTNNATSPSVPKPTGPSSGAKYSGWQPPSQAAPASGWTSNSIKSGTSGTTAPSQKFDATSQLTEQDTLVQRAEHIPAGKRTPMCAQCNQVIRGPFLVALGKSWHPEEFNCAHCKTSMAYIGFVEEKGALYCEVCYEKFFAPECSKCQRKILGEVINALKQTWHVSCFVCVACHNPIRNNVFHLEDGDPYCETDYYALFGTLCHGCEFKIDAGDRFLEALGFSWHDTCFVCAVCNDSLEGQTFFSKKDKPLCKKHAHSINI